MTAIPRAIETVRELVPDLDGRISQFEVETFEMDDELIEAFCEELDRLAGDMEAGVDESDDEKIRMSAHSIKGMGGTMGLPEISVLAQEIEMTMSAGKMDQCKRLCGAMIGWSRGFVAGIK